MRKHKSGLKSNKMSKVSRSIYQKVVEENKRLMSDIRLLTENSFNPLKLLCIQKWREKFRKEKEFNERMKEFAKEYIKEHADELPEFLTKSINENTDKNT